ncbi:adhesion G protein-coupled receptor E5 isoform X2 [Perca fluviatilis]|uniref:adhesion G protein-coupled receptor E5 isoform X2 n=1 Tax=Perca fluviatilis TaxID=8168 RepID=UPI001966376D|nr:adhesion G protein-coupled receptor E5 isoform X2 [Perca fluviatilis]
MAARWKLLILALYLSLVMVLSQTGCPEGYSLEDETCVDYDECAEDEDYPDVIGQCGEDATCHNTNGSFYCRCLDGYRSSGDETSPTCKDINECAEDGGICGLNAICFNTIPHYSCICDDGFISTTGVESFRHGDNVTCQGEKVCGQNATCVNTPGSYLCVCNAGFGLKSGKSNFSGNQEQCEDTDECQREKVCGHNATCVNTPGSYLCVYNAGFELKSGKSNFSGNQEQDTDECQREKVCGHNATCVNTPGSYLCVYNAGFGLKSGKSNFSGNQEQDICMIDKTICGNGTCHHGANSHYCACHAGFTNYGNKGSRCTALNCDVFKNMSILEEKLNSSHNLMMQLKKSCLDLTESENPTEVDGEELLKRLLSLIDHLLSRGAFKDNRKVSTFLNMVENILGFIGPFIKPPGTTRSSTHTEMGLRIHKGADLPQGAVTLSSNHVRLDIQLETAAGEPSYYPGFTTVSLLSYANLEDSADGFFSGMKRQADESFKINSKVVTATVSNRNTSHLKEPVKLTFNHLKQSNESNHTCVFWDSSENGGSWSARGCSVVESSPNYTMCSCNHLSSFAVLMALYEIKDNNNNFVLKLITQAGLSLSLICLFLCILTFSLIRSIKSPRTTIHLHLCISLFFATVIFLAGFSRTENRVGCAVVAGLLHFFFLAAFCWMCLEGIQLFRMVVLVFNANFKILYMMAGGYGVPAVIVAIAALANPKGYGTETYCWLNLEFIWSFFAPACVIIIVNVFFFLITVWKLAQKFSSLNPDLDNLQKIKAFTITAVAQLCLLGTMWIFGCFQFEDTIISSYLFTIFGSFQGVMLFVMHCLFSKQVREEYGNILSRFCAPGKKSYSNFNYSHTSKAHASKSTQDTGESRI